jgi:hypothetical protein
MRLTVVVLVNFSDIKLKKSSAGIMLKSQKCGNKKYGGGKKGGAHSGPYCHGRSLPLNFGPA